MTLTCNRSFWRGEAAGGDSASNLSDDRGQIYRERASPFGIPRRKHDGLRYPIGSGVVEGTCRHLVKDRMEQAGMRWRIAGAQATLSLRAIYVNDDWHAFHADRIQTEQRKLYPYKKHLGVILNCAT
jgi:hypothetical protein